MASASPGNRRDTPRKIWMVAGFAIAATSTLFLIAGWESYRTVDKDARARVASKARLVAAQVGSLERSIDATLDQLLFESAQAGRCEQKLVERLGQFYPEIRSITVVDPRGIIRCSNRAELVGVDRSAEDYFKKILAQPQAGVLTIEKPVLSSVTGVPI
jgi:hypothetical protein